MTQGSVHAAANVVVCVLSKCVPDMELVEVTPRQIHQGTNRVHTNVFSECTPAVGFEIVKLNLKSFSCQFQLQIHSETGSKCNNSSRAG